MVSMSLIELTPKKKLNVGIPNGNEIIVATVQKFAKK
jgi:hypothetical protein